MVIIRCFKYDSFIELHMSQAHALPQSFPLNVHEHSDI